ncbi:MAG: hypothetical protein U0736_22990 [Gemmataceae bacterium]
MVRRLIGTAVSVTLLAVLVTGCGQSGGGGGALSGTVAYKGKPLNSGTIFFLNTKGGKDAAPVSGSIDRDGKYSVKGVPPGDAKVYVIVPKGTKGTKTAAGGMDIKMDTPGSSSATPVEVPDKYSKADTSPLTVQVKNGKQEHNVNLD